MDNKKILSEDKKKVEQYLKEKNVDKKILLSLRKFHGYLIKEMNNEELEEEMISEYYSLVVALHSKIVDYNNILNISAISPVEKKMVEELDHFSDDDIRSVIADSSDSPKEQTNVSNALKSIAKVLSDTTKSDSLKSIVQIFSDKDKIELKEKKCEELGKCPTVLFVYSPSCGYCTKFYPSWNKLVEDFDAYVVNMVPVDGSLEKNKSIVEHEKLNLNGFPSLYLINEGTVYDFYTDNQSLDFESAKNFLMNLL